MTDKKKIRLIVILIFGINLLFSSIFIIYRKTSRNPHTNELIDARITDIVEYSDFGDISYDVFVSYVYNGKTYNNVPINTYVFTMDEGDTIQLYINKYDPYDIDVKMNDYMVPLILTVIAGSVIIFVLCCTRTVRRTVKIQSSTNSTLNNHIVDKNETCGDSICNDNLIFDEDKDWRMYTFKKDNSLDRFVLLNFSNNVVYSITKTKHKQYIFKDEEDLISRTYKVDYKRFFKQDPNHPEWYKIPMHLFINDVYICEYLSRMGYNLYFKQGSNELSCYVHGLGGNVGNIRINNALNYFDVKTNNSSIDVMSLICFGILSINKII